MGRNRYLSRRQFFGAGSALAWASLASASTTYAPRHLARNDEVLPIGFIGVGGMGRTHFNRLSRDPRVRLIAVADPDALHRADAVQHSATQGQSTQGYADFREMLARHPELAAVFVSTPDHWHAKAAMECLEAGKDVYCEPPLALTIGEGRAVLDTARRLDRVLCVGGLQHGDPPAFRQAGDWARSGEIGTLERVVCFFGPNPQAAAVPEEAPPAHLDWERYLGPAPWQPYHRLVHPYHFRYFRDFSGGVLTEWGIHLFNAAQWGMGKEHSSPLRVKAEGQWWEDNLYEFPRQARIRYDYGGVVLEWFQDEESVLAKRFGPGARYGIQFVGSEGEILANGPTCVARDRKGRPLQIAALDYGPSANLYEAFFEAVWTGKPLANETEAAHRSATLAHLGNMALTAKSSVVYDPRNERAAQVAQDTTYPP